MTARITSGRLPRMRHRIAAPDALPPQPSVFSPVLTLLRMDDEDRSVRCEPARRRRNAAASALPARPSLSVHSREFRMTDSHPRHALYELACRYAQAVDRRDWPRLAALFTADAQLDGPGFRFDDRDAIVAGMSVIERYETTQHHVHNQLVTLDGGEADVETYGVACHVYVRDGVKRKLDWGLRYRDRCVFDGGTWRFAARTLHVDWSQDLPLEG